MKNQSYKRHLAKTFTWRFVGTVDTIVLSWIISGNPMSGLKIGFAEVITKMVLYYVHERLWFKYKIPNSKKRHLVKTITWRFVGTLDTMLIAWLITGNAMVGLQIGMSEVVTKMILYYMHERLWYKIDYGIKKYRRAKKWKRTS
ncbi:DUF2061 domain-containing protein [Aquimarina sp. M1]